MSAQQGGRSAYFDSLYGSGGDPYGVRTRWYEPRKRAALLASLPRQRYSNAFEPACGIGELTADLAERCHGLLASDFNPAAVAAAKERTAQLANVRVERHALPQDWPRDAPAFDLIVLSEIGYFLNDEELRELAALSSGCLALDGTLVACHWTGDFAQRTIPTQTVHAVLGDGLCSIVLHTEADYLLEVWTRDGRSVAQQDGIR